MGTEGGAGKFDRELRATVRYHTGSEAPLIAHHSSRTPCASHSAPTSAPQKGGSMEKPKLIVEIVNGCLQTFWQTLLKS